ncbi:MAG: DUF4874 domain-containing protein [Proteobacteria bacterium]|nr:DUF4874 domain-containing protein [Pseudomonadota bacterium]
MWWLLACTGPSPDSGTRESPTDSPVESPSESPVDSDSGFLWDPLPGEVTLTWTPEVDRSATLGNPWSGFVPNYGWGDPSNDLEHSLEYVPISMAELYDDAELDWTALEDKLIESEARGNHAIVRIWIDWPAYPAGLPDWIDVETTPYEDHGGGNAPDWDDPDLQDAMVELVESFGQTYDGDVRLAVVQAGLIGFWGEWHTYPYDWMPDDTFQERLLTAYADSFPGTALQVRLPYANAVEAGIGFHDDSFAYSTVGETDWFFVPTLESRGADEQWRVAPIGGELRPELQQVIFTDAYTTGEYAQDFAECVEATHVSWLIDHYGFHSSGDELAVTREAAASMGAAYVVEGVELDLSEFDGVEALAELRISVRNVGVAPYYDAHNLEWAWGELAADQTFVTGQPDQALAFTHSRRVPVDASTMTIGLTSDQLLGGQTLSLAHPGGALSLPVELGCGDSAVGDVVDDCMCDVDGVFRDPDGEGC